MNYLNYPLPENLVLRICGYFENAELTDEDYFSSTLQKNAENRLLQKLDKEYSTKSRLMGLTNEGIIEYACCPLHVNEGLKPVMSTVRKTYHIGKGNVGFGSAFFCMDPCKNITDYRIVKDQKMIGGFANIAYGYSNIKYIQKMAKYHMLPLTVDEKTVKVFSKDSYILLKDIRTNIKNRKAPEAFVIFPGKELKQIELGIATMKEEDREKMLK